ncbi:unnamed protein product [Urochloa decumbens]|uniref:Uncharacterized protein n=1 Tax=Urochloa decumbens TaxID=240449 RepID=A0ABC9GH61_9POAL
MSMPPDDSPKSYASLSDFPPLRYDDDEDGYIKVETSDTAADVPIPPRFRPVIRMYSIIQDYHELVFDYFCGVPTLYTRPLSVPTRQGVADAEKKSPPPLQATGMQPFYMKAYVQDTGLSHFMYWARPGEEEGLLGQPPLRGISKWVKIFKANLGTFGWLGSVMRHGLEAPRCFTFTPDMVVMYFRKHGLESGGFAIMSREYCAPDRKKFSRVEIGTLAPRTILY